MHKLTKKSSVKILICTGIFIFVLVTLVVTHLLRTDEPKGLAKISGSVSEVECSPSQAFLIGFQSLDVVASDVPIIVIAKPQGPVSEYRFKISKVLKGNQLSKGDIIDVCPVSSFLGEQSSFDPALLLIRGADRSRSLWITQQDGFGIVENASKTKFRLPILAEGHKDYSEKEIQDAINKAK